MATAATQTRTISRELPDGDTQHDVLGPMTAAIIGQRTLSLTAPGLALVVGAHDLIPAILDALDARNEKPNIGNPRTMADTNRWLRWRDRQRAIQTLRDQLGEILPPAAARPVSG